MACTHDCSNCSEKCSSHEAESLIEKPHELSHIKKVIGIVSGKGGVGKSLITSLLAVTMARRGYSTAILDADITGPSIPRIFGIKERAVGNDAGILPAVSKMGTKVMSVNLLLDKEDDPVVWRGPVIAGMVKQFWTDVIWDDVDYMFVDMPPGTGDVPLTVFQSIPVDSIVIATAPQELVGMIVGKAVNMANLMNIRVSGIVENMSYFECPDCGKRVNVFGESGVEAAAGKYSIKNIARIPIDPKLAAACDSGTIELFDGTWLDGLADILEK